MSSDALCARQVSDRERWNGFVAEHPFGHVLQSFEWGEFKAAWGWEPLRLLFEEAGRAVAAASLLLRPLPLRPYALAYVPKGPVVDYSRPSLAAAVLRAVAQVAGRRGALLVKVDPEVLHDDLAALAALGAAGFRAATEQVQRPNTAVLDLRPSLDEILAAMKQKTRYNIRLAERRGVVVEQAGPETFREFYAVYQETGRRDDFIVRPYEYCRRAWQLFLERGHAAFFVARFQGQLLGGVIPFAFGHTAWYMYGASASVHRNLMANNLLQWRVIEWARARGCTAYDMWGAPDVLREGEPLWGPYQFKLGFGARLVRHAGAHDRALRPGLARLLERALPAYQEMLRRLHGERAPRAGSPLAG